MADLPPEPDRQLSTAVLVPWMAAGALSTLAAVIAASILTSALGDEPGWVAPVAWTAVALFGIVSVVVAPLLRYRTWRYAVREEELDLVSGAFVRRRTIVPMARVQHVDTRQDAFGRMLGLATLNVHTAAARHEVPGLQAGVAFSLRTEIARRARVADEV